MEGKLTSLEEGAGGGGGERRVLAAAGRRPGGGDGERKVLAAAATGRGGLAAVAVRVGRGSRRWRRWRVAAVRRESGKFGDRMREIELNRPVRAHM